MNTHIFINSQKLLNSNSKQYKFYRLRGVALPNHSKLTSLQSIKDNFQCISSLWDQQDSKPTVISNTIDIKKSLKNDAFYVYQNSEPQHSRRRCDFTASLVETKIGGFDRHGTDRVFSTQARTIDTYCSQARKLQTQPRNNQMRKFECYSQQQTPTNSMKEKVVFTEHTAKSEGVSQGLHRRKYLNLSLNKPTAKRSCNRPMFF